MSELRNVQSLSAGNSVTTQKTQNRVRWKANEAIAYEVGPKETIESMATYSYREKDFSDTRLTPAFRQRTLLLSLRESGTLGRGRDLSDLIDQVITLPSAEQLQKNFQRYLRSGALGDANVGRRTGKRMERYKRKNNPLPHSAADALKPSGKPTSRQKAEDYRAKKAQQVDDFTKRLIGPAPEPGILGALFSSEGKYTEANTFSTRTEAALDFAKTYNADSIRIGREYGVLIFEVKVAGDTRYIYNLPNVGDGSSVYVNNEPPVGAGRAVSSVHTHANSTKLTEIGTTYRDEHPGIADIAHADQQILEEYLVTPEGKLLMYDTEQQRAYPDVGDRKIPYHARHYPKRAVREPNAIKAEDLLGEPFKPVARGL